MLYVLRFLNTGERTLFCFTTDNLRRKHISQLGEMYVDLPLPEARFALCDADNTIVIYDDDTDGWYTIPPLTLEGASELTSETGASVSALEKLRAMRLTASPSFRPPRLPS